MFGDAVAATAILDRLLHHSQVITIRGDSYRLRDKRRSGLLQKAAAHPDHVGELINPGGNSRCRRGQIFVSFDKDCAIPAALRLASPGGRTRHAP